MTYDFASRTTGWLGRTSEGSVFSVEPFVLIWIDNIKMYLYYTSI